MDGAPPIGQRLGVEIEYRPADEGQGRDGLIFDACDWSVAGKSDARFDLDIDLLT